MVALTPEQLLERPDLVTPVAPWCAVLENLELGLILRAQPWIAGEGLRRADLERQLTELATVMPIGPLYFQRINRAVADLEERGILRGSGAGRHRRFVLTPAGFAALILNLHVLRANPTLDGNEFELKRELVALWNLLMDRLLTTLPDVSLAPEIAAFFNEVDRLSIWGRPVITSQVIRDAFNVLRLIDRQRQRVLQLKAESEARLVQTRTAMEFLRAADLTQLDWSAMGEAGAAIKENPAMIEVLRALATSAAAESSVQAHIIRYDTYLTYLERLTALYATELTVVDIEALRRRAGGKGA